MNKLEQHIKQKLEQRELQPSEDAWGKIESRLGNPKDSKRKAGRNWYAVAAVFLGALLVTTLYWNSDNELSPQTEIVDTEISTEEVKDENGDDITNNEQPLREELQAIPERYVQSEVLKDKDPIVDETPDATIKIDEVVALNDGLPEKQQLIINRKVDEVFAKVALLENSNTAVTDAEVDSLLRTAQNEILAEKVIQENGSVDAMALLAEVEDELDNSFRDQIFEALKQGYTKLKTGVAARNN